MSDPSRPQSPPTDESDSSNRPTTVHVPVLLAEVLDGLALKTGGIYLDGTLGGGGHTGEIARQIGPEGRVIALDRDAGALDRSEKRLIAESLKSRVRLAQANYRDFPEVLEMVEIPRVDGFLLDLGLSSDQLADRQRGFSFDSDGPLDLRFDPTEGETASELLRRLDEEKIADLIFRYGEERFSRRIAREVVRCRENGEPIESAAEMAEICRRTIPHSRKDRIDPATRTFQALRIAVNDELGSLADFLKKAPNFLNPGGRIAIISFHSLEDRIVKTAFRDDSRLEVETRKPILASERETEENPRSRSAKLRIARRPNA